MSGPDEARGHLKTILAEFRDFCESRGGASEADTRAKVIDRVLKEVCGWPEARLSREDRVTSWNGEPTAGFVDYVLSLRERPYLAIEAKREGRHFSIPKDTTHKRLGLSGTLITDANVKQAIEQVRGYCDDLGIRYAIATNGYTWIAFRAIREDIGWRQGRARVFPSLHAIYDDFTEFWNLLSWEAVTGGAFDKEFGPQVASSRGLHRVSASLFNADLPLRRNRLSTQLQPLVQTIFSDIADQDQLEILQSCYVHTASLRVIASDLGCIIEDSVPQFLVDEGVRDIGERQRHGGSFGRALKGALSDQQHQRSSDSHKGRLFLLLGGIGSGKTTFLKRYQRTVGKDILDRKAFWFHIDFLQAPLNFDNLELFVYQTALDQLRERYADGRWEKYSYLRRAFAAEIRALEETELYKLDRQGDEYKRILRSKFPEWQRDLTAYVPKLLRTICKAPPRVVLFFVDNVDQLAPEYQQQVFLLAQRITRLTRGVTVISLREESYYAASVQKTFTAYSTQKFHIASPHFRVLIDGRINYAEQALADDAKDAWFVKSSTGAVFNKADILDLLRIVRISVFQQNRNIARLIEAICFGNMRLALQMFTTFLVSGATDVDKMLNIYRRDGAYYVAYHEFTKSIMLGDRRYYKETQSPILNLFDVGAEANSSHFTSIRVLRALLARRGESSIEGRGYVDVSSLLLAFEDVFDNRDDFVRSCNRLVRAGLVETSTRSTEGIEGASHIRVTSSGWYYARHLVNSFAYLDLVLQDTPFSNSGTERSLRDSVYRVDNLRDPESDKADRMQTRFNRVELFLEYLEKEEEGEIRRYELRQLDPVFSTPIARTLRRAFGQQRGWIERRLEENRERFEDETELGESDSEERELLDDAYDSEVASDQTTEV